MKRTGLLMLSMIVVIAFSVSFVEAQPKSIKVGWSGPLTGPAAEIGQAKRQGATLAMEEWNAKGGIYVAEAQKKVPLEILFEDSQSKVEVGVSLGEKLLSRDKVNLLISDAFHSSISMAVMELAPKYNVPIMCGGTSDEISKKIAKDPARYKFFWKNIFGSTDEGKGVFNAYKDLIDQKLFVPKNKTVMVMGEDSDFSRAHATAIKDNFEKIGWSYLGMEAVQMGNTDFYPQLNKIKSTAPDILVLSFASLSSGAAAVRQFHEVGVKSSLITIYIPTLPEFIPQTGKASEYLLWLPQLWDDNRPNQKEFAEKFNNRFKQKSKVENVWGYEDINNVGYAVEKAASLNPDKIVDALSKLDRKSLWGRYVYDQTTHTLRTGPEYIALPVAQIAEGKDWVVLPNNLAQRKYVPQPWTK